jgi:hypothetical protein
MLEELRLWVLKEKGWIEFVALGSILVKVDQKRRENEKFPFVRSVTGKLGDKSLNCLPFI